MIDYARPLINVEFMTRVISDACLKQDYENAELVTIELMAEVKLLKHTLTVMKERQAEANGRIQSPSV